MLLGGVVVEPAALGVVVVEPGIVDEAGGLVVPGVVGDVGVVGELGVVEPGAVVSGMVPGVAGLPGVVGVPGVGSGLVPGVIGVVGLGDADVGAVSLGMADGVPLGEVVSGVTVVESLLLGAALPFRLRLERCVVPGVLWVVVLGVVV